MTPKPCAVGLKEAARRLNISYDHARHLVADGRFPIPALPRTGRRGWWKYSETVIDQYLTTASTADAMEGH